jgi:hypothetical protein
MIGEIINTLRPYRPTAILNRYVRVDCKIQDQFSYSVKHPGHQRRKENKRAGSQPSPELFLINVAPLCFSVYRF